MSHKTLQKNISRLMALLLCAMLLMTAVPIARAAEGSCGDNLTWSFEEETLTISGSGAMWNFPESTMAPWYNLRMQIRNLVLPEGLTHVGALAFYDCSQLTIVNLPDKVVSIGKYAFASCEKIRLLDLGDGLQTIGESAFHGCWELMELRLPQSLQSIGEQAFYDCSSITSVIIPEGVTRLGSAVFAYCTALVRAEIRTNLRVLPQWTFFGCSQLNTLILPTTITEMENAALRECDNLHTVSYGGSNLSMEELKDRVEEDVPGFSSTGSVTDEDPGPSASGSVAAENSDGSITEQITTVTGSDNSTVSATVDRTFGKEGGDTISSDITVTVENDKGWEEATQGIQSALDNLADRTKQDDSTGKTNITVYIKDSDKLSNEFVDPLIGSDVKLTVVTKDGSSWILDCSTLKKQELSGSYDLRYTVEPADADALALLGVTQGYHIRFMESAVVETEVLIALPTSVAQQTATLFRLDGRKTLTRFQSVMVDMEGFAHLYLGSVDGDTDYFLAINIPEADEEAIIPNNMQQAYPQMEYIEPIQYEITGRTSSWGMNLGQVMGIMAAVMVSVIVIVGVVIFTINKRRIRKGYVPGWDDLDDEE